MIMLLLLPLFIFFPNISKSFLEYLHVKCSVVLFSLDKYRKDFTALIISFLKSSKVTITTKALKNEFQLFGPFLCK